MHSPEEVVKIKAMAAGLNPFFRTLGQALGIVIAQAAFTNQLKKRLGPSVALDAASLGQEINALPKSSSTRLELVNAFDDSLRVVWWVLFALAAAMLLVTLFTKDITLRPKLTLPSSIKSAHTSNLSLAPKSSGTRSPRTISSMGSLARLSATSAEMVAQEGKSMLSLPRMLSTESFGFTRNVARESALMTPVEESIRAPSPVARREVS